MIIHNDITYIRVIIELHFHHIFINILFKAKVKRNLFKKLCSSTINILGTILGL